MSSLRINPGSLPQVVRLPGSKSYANRILILAALKSQPFRIQHLPESSDVIFLVQALGKIGLKLDTLSQNELVIQNSFPECEGEGAEIDIGEGGTTARFLASLLLLGKQPYTLVLGRRLKERPWEEFISLVRSYGAEASLQGDRLRLQGPLKLPPKVTIDCSRTTQFASGIRLAFSSLGTEVEPLNLDSSHSYWAMTEELIQTAAAVDCFGIPLDWSSASYPLAFAALNHPISFPDLSFDPSQSDAKFFSLLKGFSALLEGEGALLVHPIDKAHDVNMDVSDCLDLVPTLAFFLAHIEGMHELKGIKNLVFKESDRLSEVRKLLSTFQRKTAVVEDVLVIEGHKGKVKQEVCLELPDDHRMVMVASLFLRHHSGGTVSPAEAVKKSYPNFFELFT